MRNYLIILLLAVVAVSCSNKKQEKELVTKNMETPFVWENANIYFLLTIFDFSR